MHLNTTNLVSAFTEAVPIVVYLGGNLALYLVGLYILLFSIFVGAMCLLWCIGIVPTPTLTAENILKVAKQPSPTSPNWMQLQLSLMRVKADREYYEELQQLMDEKQGFTPIEEKIKMLTDG